MRSFHARRGLCFEFLGRRMALIRQRAVSTSGCSGPDPAQHVTQPGAGLVAAAERRPKASFLYPARAFLMQAGPASPGADMRRKRRRRAEAAAPRARQSLANED